MSGNGDRGGGGDGGGGSQGCETLRFEAQLTSPQPAVVGTLRLGDVLDLAVVDMNGQVVVHVLKGGQVAGGLTGPDATRLRGCIQDGHDFKATVLTVNGGQVRVRVEHA